MADSDGGSARSGFVAGLVAGAAAVVALLGMRALAGGPSLPELVEEGIVRLMPGWLFSALLDRLRFSGKPLLFGLILVGMLLVGGAIGARYARAARGPFAPVWLALP